jgi:hypothetical protein
VQIDVTARHTPYVASLRRAVEDGPGETDTSLRHAVSARAAEQCHGDATTELPAGLASYVDKVAIEAYKVTDKDVEALKQSGLSEDEIFEVTVATALGAGLERLAIGLHALGGEST